jgi:hypothetical protein
MPPKGKAGGKGEQGEVLKVLKPSPERASTRPRRNLVAPPVVKGRHVFEGGKAGEGGKEGGEKQQGLGKRKRGDDEFGSAFSFLSVNKAKVTSRSPHIPPTRKRC